jgi:hypothetical protein
MVLYSIILNVVFDYRIDIVLEKRFCFEFQREFHNPDDNSIVVYYFTVMGSEDLFEKYSSESDDVIFFVGDMEEYGVHDFCADPATEWTGYYTYEIKKEDELTVINEWRDQIARWGFELGPTHVVDYEEYEKLFKG